MMKRKLLTALLATSIVVSGSTFYQPLQSSADTTATIVQSVNFRDEPSLSGNQIRYLRTGESVTVLEKVNDYWYKVKDSRGTTGYVTTKERYIELSGPLTTFEGNATVVSGVSFRTGPSTSNDRMRYLQTGESVLILEKVNSYWYKVQDQDGTTGYVSTSSKYIETSYTEPAPAPSVTFKGNADIIRSVSFRTGPSTSYDRIRYLQTGESVLILEQVNSYWYQAQDENGTIGYVSSSERYIDTDYSEDSAAPEFEGNAVVVSSVSFRTGPSTSYDRMRYLQTGESVLILEKANSYWYKVQDQNGTVGYVSTSSRYIETSYVEPAPSAPSVPASVLAQKVIDAGMKYLGTPYEFGSSRSNTDTFDCSDFVRQAFLEGIGLKLPADSRQQGEFVKNIGKTSTDWRQLQPGDIMFFMSYKGSRVSDYDGIDKQAQRITHNGIYLGDGKVLHTYSVKSGGVKISSIEGTHWEYRFIFGGSAIK
jgi:cell wall-associated NlpC family hydrolase/cation transport regulator ChaC